MKYKLEEIVDVTMGQSPKSQYFNPDGNGMPFLQGNRTFGFKRPAFDTYTTLVTKPAQAGDVIMSVRAPVGDLNITPVEMCLGRGVCSLRMKNGNQEFLYYMMKYYMPQLLNKESGTVFGSVNRNDINRLEVDIPNESEKQQRIARYLTMIDDKIELNMMINDNLEQQAQSLFLRMFPSILSDINGTVGDLVSFSNGKKRPNIEGNIPVYGGNGILAYTNKSNSQNCIIIGRVGAYCGSIYYSSQPCWISDNAISAQSKKGTAQLFSYYLLKNAFLPNRHIGTSQPLLTQGILTGIPCCIPNDDEINAFNDMCTPLQVMLDANIAENAQLSLLRDIILPKLMSSTFKPLNYHL